MYKRILKSLVFSSFAALVAASAGAQVLVDIGDLQIRIVTDAPPTARRELQPARPHADDLWIGGYWGRHADNWTWTPGRWDRPAAPRARWIAPRYQRVENHWHYHPGHWSNQKLVEGDDYKAWKVKKGKKGKKPKK